MGIPIYIEDINLSLVGRKEYGLASLTDLKTENMV